MTFSVIVPAFNVAPYLRTCLASLIAQDFRDWEAICIDDGSTDGTGAILDEFSLADSRIVVIHQANKGVSAARNAGIERARGEWIGFVDADDSIDTHRLSRFEKLVRSTGMPDIASLSGMLDVADETKESPGQSVLGCMRLEQAREIASSYRLSDVVCRNGDPARVFALGRFAKDGWPFLNVVRRDFLGETRFTEGIRIKEDILFFMDLALRAEKVAFARCPGYFYTHREGSALAGQRRIDDNLAFLRELRRYPDVARRDVSRAAGWDLIHWAHNRQRYEGDDGGNAQMLSAWRTSVADGIFRISEIYPWWRPGIWHWLKTGSPFVLDKTFAFRAKFEWLVRRSP